MSEHGNNADLDAYRRAENHHRTAPGCEIDTVRLHYLNRQMSELDGALDAAEALLETNRAWTAMLYRRNLISSQLAVDLFEALDQAEEEGEAPNEYYLKKQFGLDEDTASAVNLGRTAQEPMSRLQQRRKLLEVMEELLTCLDVVLNKADEHAETVMAGMTHLSHAQPTTYGAYLLSIHDGLARGLEQLELAFRHINLSSAGCGALAGSGWPVDRQMVAELLGMDGLVEPAYDCEAGQDHALTALFAITNICVLLSRTAMDHNIWGMDGVNWIAVSPGWAGVSSLMPQKCMTGSQFERVRMQADDVIGHMITGVVAIKGEPHADMLPIYEAYRGGLRAMCHAEMALGFFTGLVADLEPDKEKLLRLAREGFAATPDLAIVLIRDKGYGGRRAHRTCATFVRYARERCLKATETTGALLDEAAEFLGYPPPRLSDDEVREALDPEKFIERHNNVGDPHPDETRRMIAARREALDEARERHAARLAKVTEAAERRNAEIQSIREEHRAARATPAEAMASART